MRTVLKRDILKMFETLHQAHLIIKNHIELKQYGAAKDVLGQCQESAVSIGTAIERAEGEGTVTVSYLEKYCEMLYSAYEALNRDYIKAGQICKRLNKSLLAAENSVKQDIPVRYEIVFLPYKASMWDSLASVWKAADEEPDCDAYVIPIPYYDKNPDGSFRTEHYDGGAFPADVPITHYNDYDFENRHPDVIFIHNPYDQYNCATSVHPFFYSSKLKKYTGKLVYIPYYISAECDSNNSKAWESRKGHIVTSGAIHSDMVVVQSENTKKGYVNVLEKELPELPRKFWEQKIWGLGSPKLDFVNGMQRDDEKLPENWKKIIYTEEKVRKKVVLYNISVAISLDTEEMFAKIKDTLNFFKENRDVALWWRPHPLYASNLASVSADLLEEYEKIVDQYKKEAWGIFDEGADLDWAIAETDAYYGDRSSVVELYKEMEKPAMIQSESVRTDRKKEAEDIPVWPSAFYADEENIWFTHGKINVLLRYNIKEDNTYVMDQIPNERLFQNAGYTGIYKWKNKIFLVPSWARELAVYNVENKNIEKIPLRYIQRYGGKSLFAKAYAKGKILYCIPCCYECILKINMETNQVEYIAIESTEGMYFNDTVRMGDEIAAVYVNSNKILFFNMETDTVSYQSLGDTSWSFTSIANIGKDLYLFDEQLHVVMKFGGKGYTEVEKFCDLPHKNVRMVSIYPDLLLLDSIEDYEILILDREKKIVFQTGGGKNIWNSGLHSQYYCGIEGCNQEDCVPCFYYSRGTYSMHRFDGKGKVRQLPIKLEPGELQKLTAFFERENGEADENDIYTLEKWIKGMGKTEAGEKRLRDNCGKRILEAVKKAGGTHGVKSGL